MEDNLRQFETSDKLKLYYRHWLADNGAPCVVYLHGLESHMDWFANMAEFLNSRGFNVYAFDRRGSGLNKEQRGHLYSYHYLFDDIKLFSDLIKKDHPKSKIFLIGLCLGGKIAVNFYLFFPKIIDGLILVSPSIENRLKFPFFKKLNILLSAIFRPRKMFKIPIEDSMFTTNKKYLDMMNDDPSRLRYISGRYFWEIAKMDLHLTTMPHKINIPILVMLAGIDEIVDTESVREWYDLIISSQKTIKVYENYYHMLLFEENSEEIMKFIVDWIKANSGFLDAKSISN